MATIGNLYINVAANIKGVITGLNRAEAKLKRFSRNAQRTGRQMQTLGKQMAGMATLFAAPAVAGIRVFASFEKQMANVSTMLDKPEQHMGRFTQGVQDMAVEFGESTETLAGGLYDILSASIAPAKAMEVLRVASMAAKAGLTDTATSADAITTVLNSYGLSADQAMVVSDKLFTVVKKGKTTFAELAPNIGKSASLANTAGVSMDELFATISVLTRNGVKTEVAMTAINAVMSAFTGTSEQAALAASELDLEMTGSALAANGLLGSLEKLAGADIDKLSEIFPNIRAIRGVSPLLKDLGGFGDDIAAIGGGAGATTVAFDKMAKTLDTTLGQVRESVKAIGVALGEALAGDVREWSTSIVQTTKDAIDWIKQNKEFIVSLTKTVVEVAAVGAALFVLGTAYRACAGTVTLLVTAFKVLQKTMLLTKVAMVAFTATAKATQGGLVSLNGALGKKGKLLLNLAGLTAAFWAGSKAGTALGKALGIIPEQLQSIQDQAESVSTATQKMFDNKTATNTQKQEAALLEVKARQEEIARIAEEIDARKQYQESWSFWAVEGLAGATGGGFLGDDTLTSLESKMMEAQNELQEAYKRLRSVDQAKAGITTGAQIEKMISGEDAAKNKTGGFGGWLESQKQTVGMLADAASSVYEAATDGLQKHMGEVRKLSRERADWMRDQARQLSEQFATPQEVFDKQMGTLKELQTAGAITQELFDRAAASYAKELKNANTEHRVDRATTGSIATAIGSYTFATPNRSQSMMLQQSQQQTTHQKQIATSTAATAKALQSLGPK